MENYKHENLKFRVKDEAHSREIQELLFKLGYDWLGNASKIVQYTDNNYHFTYLKGSIKFGNTEQNFLEKNAKEVNIQYLKSKLGLSGIGLDYEIY